MRVGFCVSGEGRLCRLAINHAEALEITPSFLLLDSHASSELDGFANQVDIPNRRIAENSAQTAAEQITEVMRTVQVDLWVLTFDRMIPGDSIPSGIKGVINLHPAILPAFKGHHALKRAVEGNSLFFGASIHEIDEHVDNGPLIVQCALARDMFEDLDSARKRIWPILQMMYLQSIRWYSEDRVFRTSDGRLLVSNAKYGDGQVVPAIEPKIIELLTEK